MDHGPKNAIEFQAWLKKLIDDARWNGVDRSAIQALLRAEAEVVR